MNTLYQNFLHALQARDLTYAGLLVIAFLVVVGYYVVTRVPVPSPVYRRVLTVVYWVAVSLTYILLIVVATVL